MVNCFAICSPTFIWIAYTVYSSDRKLTEHGLLQFSGLGYQYKIKFWFITSFSDLNFIAWFNRLDLWKIGDKWRFLFHVWQIFSKPKKSHTNEEFFRSINVIRFAFLCLWLGLETVSAIVGHVNWASKEEGLKDGRLEDRRVKRARFFSLLHRSDSC